MSEVTHAERATVDVDTEGCPDCGAVLANVQGIADCPACVWTAN